MGRPRGLPSSSWWRRLALGRVAAAVHVASRSASGGREVAARPCAAATATVRCAVLGAAARHLLAPVDGALSAAAVL
eukprot:CAMPEP_0172626154 /NCGR_PEP_ID=MMETSP1068-20121228/148316_1 /TAXON_ID=35684 /ORGANISM="Pseudopedinella elastica, Strain CCMP716" /LENGTH=76 /DNA_ID=CAMNT_0013435687 /DNA_START=168 /DNA_END=394 /DNA_ORIENTATION=-